MKKLMIAASAALCAAVGFAVESANIVGYTTVPVNKQYSILAVNFQNISGGQLAIQDLFPYQAGMTKGGDTSVADNIQIMQDDGTYKTYFISNGQAGKATIPAIDGKWVKSDAASVATTDTIANGRSFWYISQAFKTNPSATPYNLQVAGQVLATSADSRDIAQKIMMVANPYPAEVPLNDGVQITKGMTKGGDTSVADNLQIMQSDGTYKTYFISNGQAGKATIPAIDGKWVKSDAASVATTDKFPVGKGAWFISQTGDTTLKFVSPMAAE